MKSKMFKVAVSFLLASAFASTAIAKNNVTVKHVSKDEIYQSVYPNQAFFYGAAKRDVNYNAEDIENDKFNRRNLNFNNEFERRDKMAEFHSIFGQLEKPDKNKEVLFSVGLRVGDYDFDKKAFPLKLSMNDFRGHRPLQYGKRSNSKPWLVFDKPFYLMPWPRLVTSEIDAGYWYVNEQEARSIKSQKLDIAGLVKATVEITEEEVRSRPVMLVHAKELIILLESASVQTSLHNQEKVENTALEMPQQNETSSVFIEARPEKELAKEDQVQKVVTDTTEKVKDKVDELKNRFKKLF